MHSNKRHKGTNINSYRERLGIKLSTLTFSFFRILVLFLPLSFSAIEEEVQYLIVQPASSIIIDGKSNVNKFRCTCDQHDGKDTLVLSTANQRAVFVHGLVNLKASGFDCGMKAITKDFTETINVEKFPFITIEFLSFEEIPKYTTTEERFTSKIKLTLASVSKTVEIRCGIHKDAQGLIHLKGARHFTFSDFKLDPPKKMGGLIKVDEKLEVTFHLVLKRR